MALIGLFIGLVVGTFGAALGLIGGFIGIVVGLLGALIGLLPIAVPVVLIALGIVWLVRSSNRHDHYAPVQTRPAAPPTTGNPR